ncbi:flagellar transcriptional regulator FlhD [Halochromatium salexigens]|uniref:Flagellar transcriptional regulator FlhD n=1 Tax=Halochromatium salexigens TaxID=49447 RepID=A0AAJ0UE20_HALSE|nr:flagellar transcriptional regulator FlhD [Halochromatium salexigens]MBK5929724.1 flagellar transcriptional regulator FlhD [Halochromatium salexigens]
MNETSLINEIEDLNLAYLLLAQRMLRHDRPSAMFRLKIDSDMAEQLLSLSARQLAKLARSNQLLCRFGYEDAAQLRAVTRQPREHDLSGFHSSLLMASQPQAGAENTET